MTAYAIDEKLCVECGQCRRFCPIKDAIIINADYQHTVVADLCSGCGLCEAFCPVPGALFQPAVPTQADRKPLKILRRVVWRHKWGFHNHPLMGEVTLRARQVLRAARQQERLQLAIG
jgi:Na+-translocating ferredoxin:NAD+ oxidoreductase RNF subunit RnfB